MSDQEFKQGDITAVEAMTLAETNLRRRNAHCVTIMESTMAKIAMEAHAGRRMARIEVIGEDVDLDGYINELHMLGYNVRMATDAEALLPRSIVISW